MRFFDADGSEASATFATPTSAPTIALDLVDTTLFVADPHWGLARIHPGDTDVEFMRTPRAWETEARARSDAITFPFHHGAIVLSSRGIVHLEGEANDEGILE